MGKVNKHSIPELLNTHPSSANRQAVLKALAPQMMKYYHPEAYHPVYRGL